MRRPKRIFRRPQKGDRIKLWLVVHEPTGRSYGPAGLVRFNFHTRKGMEQLIADPSLSFVNHGQAVDYCRIHRLFHEDGYRTTKLEVEIEKVKDVQITKDEHEPKHEQPRTIDLLDFWPTDVLETAHFFTLGDFISIHAPDNPSDYTISVRVEERIIEVLYEQNGQKPDPSDLLTAYGMTEFVRGGPKVILPSAEACRVLAHVDLNIGVNDYAQPYESTGVVVPRSVTGLPKDLVTLVTWRPDVGIHVATYKDGYNIHSTIGTRWPGTLEDIFRDGDFYGEDGSERELQAKLARVALNVCLFAMEREVKVVPLDPKAAGRRYRAARGDERMARLVARDAQAAYVQGLDLILRRGGQGTGDHEATGRKLGFHRRRGHWKMQAFGPGCSQRKRIYVHPYYVGLHEGDNPPDVQSVIE